MRARCRARGPASSVTEAQSARPSHALFDGPGEVRALAREIDWSATPLGPVESWPAALRTIVRAALDSPFPINVWCGAHEPVLIYNDAYRHVMGAKHPHFFGRSGREAWAEIWPQIEPMFEQIRAGGPAIYADDAPFVVLREGEDPAQLSDEPNAWFTFSLSGVRDEDGHIVGFLNVVSETTARMAAERAREAARARAERAESRLLEVFSQAPSFMAVLRGPEHVFEYANEAYYQLIGHRELIGKPLLEALPEIREQGFGEILDQVLESGEPFIGREVAVSLARSADAAPEQRFVDFVYYPITDSDGVRSGVVAHGSDVTEHVIAREEAEWARSEAERANQAKSQFLAMMSHEIRTPINAIIGYTDLLDSGLGGDMTDRQQNFLQRVRTSSHHLLGLVDDMLDLTRIESGEMITESAVIAVETVARPALEMIVPAAGDKGITVREEGDLESLHFVGDRDRTRQILINLLSNAMKFTEPGGTITFASRQVQSPAPLAALPEIGPWILLEVEDTGSGIPADQLTRIFEPFVQVDSGHTRRASGTGLGLTISRRFARLMGGDLTVRSELGEGSRFTLWLPAPEQEPTGT